MSPVVAIGRRAALVGILAALAIVAAGNVQYLFASTYRVKNRSRDQVVVDAASRVHCSSKLSGVFDFGLLNLVP